MKTKYFVCLSLVALLLLNVGLAKADVLYSCDFEGPDYTLGNSLVGQDSWEDTFYSPPYVDPIVGAGTGVNTSNTFLGNTATSSANFITSAALREFDTPLTFDTTNTALEFRFWGLVNKGESELHSNLALNMMWEGMDVYRELMCGIYFSSGASAKPQAFYRDGNQTIYKSDTLEPGHWYEVKAVMDLSQVCSDGVTFGKLDYWYRDVTAGETEDDFTLDSTIRDKDMFLDADINGEFHSNGIYGHEQACKNYVQQAYIDNISIIDQVPEPSTVALLATGLLGLLAYAWRKRK